MPKEFLHCCKSFRADNRLSNLGNWQRDWGHPENVTLKANGILLQSFLRTGKTDSCRAQPNLVHTRTQEKGAVTPQETKPDLPVSVMESPMEVWVDTGLLPGQGNWQQSWEPQCHDVNLFQGHHYHHYPCHSLASGQTTGREQSQPTVENWIKDLLSMASPTREMQFSPQPVPSIRKLPQASSPHLYGADRIKTTITEN